jgi:nucleoside-diphosphate-sugar epimerase
MASLIVFGAGYTGGRLAQRMAAAGWTVTATGRSPEPGRVVFDGQGVPDSLAAALRRADALISLIPPDREGVGAPLDPGLRAAQAVLGPRLPLWCGYVSTTGVYGDLGGGWADETTPLNPSSPTAARRVQAEREWAAAAERLAVFRLPGIYGPGRSALDRVGSRAIPVRPGLVFSRAHVDDIVTALELALTQAATGPFNICDDAPCAPEELADFAAALLGAPAPARVPVEQAGLSPEALRFYQDSRRVRNARAKAVLGWTPRYPSYREGLTALLPAQGTSP